jgi:viroplasmin and RNaseH domain-containing protein
MRESAEYGLLRLACSSFEDTIPGQLEFLVFMKPCSDKVKVIESWRRMESSVTIRPELTHQEVITKIAAEHQEEIFKIAAEHQEEIFKIAAEHQEEIFKIAAEHQRMTKKIQNILEECASFRNEIQAMSLTISWRITAPLRAVRIRFKRMLG